MFRNIKICIKMLTVFKIDEYIVAQRIPTTNPEIVNSIPTEKIIASFV